MRERERERVCLRACWRPKSASRELLCSFFVPVCAVHLEGDKGGVRWDQRKNECGVGLRQLMIGHICTINSK